MRWIYRTVLLSPTVTSRHMELGQRTWFPSDGNGFDSEVRINRRLIHSLGSTVRPAGGQSEATLPLNFREGTGLLLARRTDGERLRFTSWHDSNTMKRSGHRLSLSDGEREELSAACRPSGRTQQDTRTAVDQRLRVQTHKTEQ